MFTCFNNKNKSMHHFAARHTKKYKMEASLQISKANVEQRVNIQSSNL